MPAPDLALRHLFFGGFASDFGTQAEAVVDAGAIRIPFLQRAENVYFLANGAVRKIGGTEIYNQSAFAGSEEIRGLFEYVRLGTLGTPTRRRVCHAGTDIYKDDNDGNFTSIFSGLVNDSVPCYTVFEDQLIISSDQDAPRTWDQTSTALLGGSPPNFSFSCVHANRLWAAGDPANPSRLYYSSDLNAAEWNGAGNSGVINVDPEDGDKITAICRFRGSLIVFKGPNFGSIHTITGLTPSTFARNQFSTGVACAGHNSIFPFKNDIGFLASDGTIRSLVATDKFGDFEQAHLSSAISSWIFDHVNTDRLNRSWAAVDHTKGYALITLPVDNSDKPNRTLMMDFRFEEPRFSFWLATPGWCVSRGSDPVANDRPILYIGGNDGNIRKTQQPTRAVDDTNEIAAVVKTPYFHYNTQNRDKTIQHFGLGIQQHGTSTMRFSVITPVALETTEINASAGAMLDFFVLDADVLAGDSYITFWSDATGGPGQAREFCYEITNDELNQDMEVNAIHIVMETAQGPDYQNYLSITEIVVPD